MVQQKKRGREQARVQIEPEGRRGGSFTWLFVGLILAIGIIGNVFDEDITGKTTFYREGKGIYADRYQPTIAAEAVGSMGLVLYTSAADVEEFIDEMAEGVVTVEVGRLTRSGERRFYGVGRLFRFDTSSDDGWYDLNLITGQLAVGGSTFKVIIGGQNYLVTPESSY